MTKCMSIDCKPNKDHVSQPDHIVLHKNTPNSELEHTACQGLQSELDMHDRRTRTEHGDRICYPPPVALMTVVGKKEEEKGSEPLIGTIFSSGKGVINRGPKSDTERGRGGRIY